MHIGARTPTNGGTKIIGRFPSIKVGDMVWWEGQLERDYVYELEFDPDVLWYRAQPFAIPYYMDGRKRRYTPDYEVHRRTGKVIVEVKPYRKAIREEWVQRFRIMAPLIEAKGYRYQVQTDREIRRQPRLRNIRFLTRYARVRISLHDQLWCSEFFGRVGEKAPLGDLLDHFRERPNGIQVVYGLLYHGLITMDLDLPLWEESTISYHGVLRPNLCEGWPWLL